jgi:hypothetical protein
MFPKPDKGLRQPLSSPHRHIVHSVRKTVTNACNCHVKALVQLGFTDNLLIFKINFKLSLFSPTPKQARITA